MSSLTSRLCQAESAPATASKQEYVATQTLLGSGHDASIGSALSQLVKVRSPKWPHTVSKFVENADLVSVPLAQVVESVVEVVETRPGVRSYAYAMVERMVECPPPNPHTLSITQLHHQPLNPSPPLTPPIRRSMVKTATSPLRRLNKQDK